MYVLRAEGSFYREEDFSLLMIARSREISPLSIYTFVFFKYERSIIINYALFTRVVDFQLVKIYFLSPQFAKIYYINIATSFPNSR